MDALLRGIAFLFLLPEPVAGQGGGHQGRGDRQRGQPRPPAQGQQRAGHDLDSAVEADGVVGLAGTADTRSAIGRTTGSALGAYFSGRRKES